MFLLDKQGVTGSSPVSPILIYKDLWLAADEVILMGVTILWPKLLRGIGKQITLPLFLCYRVIFWTRLEPVWLQWFVYISPTHTQPSCDLALYILWLCKHTENHWQCCQKSGLFSFLLNTIHISSTILFVTLKCCIRLFSYWPNY